MVSQLRVTSMCLKSALALAFLSSGSWAANVDACRSNPVLRSELDFHRHIDFCANHAAALNNRALFMEDAGGVDEAGILYERAIASDSQVIASFVGLDEVIRRRAIPAGPTRAEREHPLLEYDAENRRRSTAAYQVATDTLRAESITRSLTTKPVRTRGLSLQSRSEPYIDIHIRFDFDSARLRPETGPQLDEIAKALKNVALRDRHIVIEGHTDSQGPDGYNRNLSIRRSAAVRLELMARGIEGHRLSALGFGESKPIADNATEAGQARNRRVTFVNMGER